MDRFFKRPVPGPAELPASKKPKVSAKQGDIAVQQRCLQYVGGIFYADGGKMFCRCCNVVVDHVRKSVVDVHVKSKVRLLLLSFLVLLCFQWFVYLLSYNASS